MSKRLPKIEVPVTDGLNRLVDEAYREGFVSKADFVRTAIRRELARMGKSEKLTVE